MKKTKYYALLLLLALLTFCGCSGNRYQSTKKNLKPNDGNSQKADLNTQNTIPDYIINPPRNNEYYIYGSGSGNTLQEAKERAKAEIVHYFRSYLESEFKDFSISHQVNEMEVYRSYTTNKLDVISHLSIPGISIIQTDELGEYYALAQLNRIEYAGFQEEIKRKVEAYKEKALAEKNPGKRLLHLLQGASLLVKIVDPFLIDELPAFIYFYIACGNILNNLDIDYSFNDISQFSEYEALVLHITNQNLPLLNVPVIIDGNSYSADKRGYYFLENEDNEPYYLNLEIDAASIQLAPELIEDEIKEAKKIVRNLCSINKDIYIEPPVKLQAFIDLSHTLDSIHADNTQLFNKIKEVLLLQEIDTVDNRYNANLLISINTETHKTSYSEYIGYCYKASGSMKISGEKHEVIIIDLSDSNVLEKTKSFSLSSESAANKALEKLNEMIVHELRGINFSD